MDIDSSISQELPNPVPPLELSAEDFSVSNKSPSRVGLRFRAGAELAEKKPSFKELITHVESPSISTPIAVLTEILSETDAPCTSNIENPAAPLEESLADVAVSDKSPIRVGLRFRARAELAENKPSFKDYINYSETPSIPIQLPRKVNALDQSTVFSLIFNNIESTPPVVSAAPIPTKECSESQQRNDIIAVLYNQRAQTALLFRRIFAASPSTGIKCRALCDELVVFFDTRQFLCGAVDGMIMWRLVCDMAGVGYSVDPDSAHIKFSDLTKFLETARGREGSTTAVVSSAASAAPTTSHSANAKKNPPSAHIDFELKRKLSDSKDVRGERLRLLACSHTLRQRLQTMRPSESRSQGEMFPEEEIEADTANLSECQKLLESIDVHATNAEMRYIFMHSSPPSDSGNSAFSVGKPYAKLHNVILFLSKCLQ